MKLPRIILPVLLVLGIAVAAPGPGPSRLVRIGKGVPGTEALLRARGLDIAQELRTCYIGRLDRDEVSFLRGAGVPVTLLDPDIAQKTYYLVRQGADTTVGLLSGRGKVAAVEPGQLLFWTPRGDGGGAIPAGLPRKRLAASSIASYLRSYPVPAVTSSGARDPLIGAIVGAVSRENLRALIGSLQDFRTRSTGDSGQEAAEVFVVNYFPGRDSRRPSRRPRGRSGHAVVGELGGTNYPDDVVVVCAHLDSTSPDPDDVAPGADDDASGMAAVMEAARILARHPTDYHGPVRRVLGRGAGAPGERRYAAWRPLGQRRIWGRQPRHDRLRRRMPEDLDVFVNPASDWMGYRISEDAAEYAGLSVRKMVDPSRSIPIMPRSGTTDTRPSSPSRMSLFTIRITIRPGTRSIPWTSSFAPVRRRPLWRRRPFSPSPSGWGRRRPRGSTAQSSFFSALLGTRKNIYLRWERKTGDASFNIYRTEIPHVFYEKVNAEPVRATIYADRGVTSGVTYYYAVTAVDQAGIESNFSREVEVLPYRRSRLCSDGRARSPPGANEGGPMNPTRRDFLRTGAAAGLGAALSALKPAAATAAPSAGKARSAFRAAPVPTVRVGFVGVGGMGSVHVQNFLNMDGVARQGHLRCPGR